MTAAPCHHCCSLVAELCRAGSIPSAKRLAGTEGAKAMMSLQNAVQDTFKQKAVETAPAELQQAVEQARAAMKAPSEEAAPASEETAAENEEAERREAMYEATSSCPVGLGGAVQEARATLQAVQAEQQSAGQTVPKVDESVPSVSPPATEAAEGGISISQLASSYVPVPEAGRDATWELLEAYDSEVLVRLAYRTMDVNASGSLQPKVSHD